MKWPPGTKKASLLQMSSDTLNSWQERTFWRTSCKGPILWDSMQGGWNWENRRSTSRELAPLPLGQGPTIHIPNAPKKYFRSTRSWLLGFHVRPHRVAFISIWKQFFLIRSNNQPAATVHTQILHAGSQHCPAVEIDSRTFFEKASVTVWWEALNLTLGVLVEKKMEGSIPNW